MPNNACSRATLVLSLLLYPTVLAGDVDTLRGLLAMRVSITGSQTGLTKSQLQTDVELRLRLAGIKVDPGARSNLDVNVGCVGVESCGHICPITVALHQPVLLVRNTSISSLASTWSKVAIAIPGSSGAASEYVRSQVADFVDKFINDYLSVNPK